MEFLKQAKNPSSKKGDLLNITIEKKRDFTQTNSENLMNFIKLLKKNINLQNFRYLGTAKKMDRSVILVQMSDENKKIIQNNKKLSMPDKKINVTKMPEKNGVANEDGDEEGVKAADKEQVKKVVVENLDDNSLMNNNHESMVDFSVNYKKYSEDDTIFKIPLIQKYVLNNKKSFTSEMRSMLSNYLNKTDKQKNKESSCDETSKSTGFEALIHQELVKQYLNSYSPYRGLLLYHGLGSGKTCTSIGVIESMKSTKKKIFILTPASLKKNYISQMKFCGSMFFQEDNDWEYVEYPKEKEERDKFIKHVHKLTRLPIKDYLNKKKGVYLQKKELTGDFDFSKIDRKVLNEQINEMIKGRFQFISYNGITMNSWKNKFKRNNENINPFDNSVIIIDEGHNFVSRVVNKLNVNGTSVSVEIYNHILTADNCNVVMLTGTPLINYPNELGVLFNLVGGCNPVIELNCSHSDNKMMNINSFKKALKDLNNIDFISYVENTNTLKIMRNPYGFVNDEEGKINYDDDGMINVKDFKDKVVELLQQSEYNILNLDNTKDTMIKMYKKFPDTKESFNSIFIDKKSDGLKNKKYFQTKISGMVSYVGDKKELMPKIVAPDENSDMFVEVVEMNENVMKQYNIARAIERALDSKIQSKKKGNDKDSQTSSYKIFSRASCNFVFPSSIERFSSLDEAKDDIKKVEERLNRPILNVKKIEDLEEDQLELLTGQEMLTMNDGKYDTQDVEEKNTKLNKKKQAEFMKKVNILLGELMNNAYKYFDSDIEKIIDTKYTKIKIDPEYEINQENDLKLYSPKFHRMLKNILNEENNGLHLMYSNFRTLEGIGIFKIILDYYGYSEFRVVKGVNKSGLSEYNIEIDNSFYYNSSFDGDVEGEQPNNNFSTLNGRKFYALYTGKEGEEEKEIIRNIYNGNFDKIPLNVRGDIRKYFFNNDATAMTNMFGEVIKLLLISSSGAEGIDLKNVRYVHITEPYWHPVRIDQVIGRAKRICSHKDLPPELQNVTVFLYLLSYNKKLLKEKETLYTQLINGDTDQDGNVTTTDEKLLKIMKAKKKLMQQFLTAMKEVSVDCIFNYEEKDKCLSFPLPKTGINPHRTLQTSLHYKDNAYENVKLDKFEKEPNADNDRGEYVNKPVKRTVLKTKYVEIDGKGGLKRKVGVDFSENPPIAFDLKDKNKLGVLEKNKKDQYVLKIE